MRYVFLSYIFGAVIIVSLFGFRGHTFTEPPVEVFNDMDRQARVNFQSGSDFFADGLGSRNPVTGTVPVGFEVPHKTVAGGAAVPEFGFSFPGDTSYYNSGQLGDFWGSGMPAEVRGENGAVDAAFIARGKERFDISCAICHGESGDGKGVLSNYGFINIANLLTPQFSDPADPLFRPDGEVFDTITAGKGLMGAYGATITVRDRWAIIAYIRTLQASNAEAKAAAAAEEAAAAPEKAEVAKPE